MDLPTYTSIWRIEKRLYKLYDFRLPMPLPIGQVTVFAAIAVPYVLLLTLLGLHFSHTLVWLYILPPGLVTWLVTRPVLEGKRLPELINSQVRYLAEPRVWCRMAPLAESDVVIVTGRVWRLSPAGVIRLRNESARRRLSQRAAAPDGDTATDRVGLLGRGIGRRPAARPATAAAATGLAVAGPAAAGQAAAGSAARRSAAPTLPAGTQGYRRPAGRPVGQPVPPGYTRPLGQPAAPSRRFQAGAAGPAVQIPAQATSAGGPEQPSAAASQPAPPSAGPARPAWPSALPARSAGPVPWPARSPTAPPTRPAIPAQSAPAQSAPAPAGPAPSGPPEPSAPAASAETSEQELAEARLAESSRALETESASVGSEDRDQPATSVPATSVAEPALARALDEQRPEDHAARSAAIAERAEPGQPGHRPVVTVVSTGSGHEAALPVEQALAGPAARRNEGRSGRVAVVPGGHRPGKPDQIQRDRARAQLPLTGHRRVVVLGCTVGAGQTMTALLTGEVLASLRSDSIAVLDLNPGAESLIKRALLRPALSQAASLGPSRLAVLGGLPPRASATSDHAVDASAALSLLDQSSARHQIVLADPSTAMVPRLLTMADQIVLVAPASAPAARAIGMTFEWLDAHGQATLAAEAIMVMNGVSRRSLPHVEQAERVCVGRCRAIVRVPWDDQLQRHPGRPAQSVPNQSGPGQPPAPHWAGLLAPATAGAYTALAGVIVASLIGHEPDRSRSAAPGEPGPARASAHGAAR